MRKLLLCIATCISLHASSQCLLVKVPLQQRIASSSLIIEGRVTEKHSFWNNEHNMIYTSNTVEIYKVFKGSIHTSYIEILTKGGIVGYNKIVADPSLTLTEGETGIFTCEVAQHTNSLPPAAPAVPRYEAYAGPQGFIKYDLQEMTAADIFSKYQNIETELYNVLSPAHNFIEKKSFSIHNNSSSARIETLDNFSPTTITAGTGSQLTINGSGFGAVRGVGVVRFRNADDGGATFITPLASQYISWSATQIVVQVPQNAGTGTIQVVQGVTFTSATPLTVTYAHLNVDFDPGPGTVAYQTDHVDDNGTGGYTWRMNTGFFGNTLAKNAFLRAFDTWRCSSKINWTIGANTAINDAVSDGTNIICFDNTAPLTPGVLGVCFSYWSGCASGPTIIWYVNELDIIFDDGSNIAPLTWQYGPANPTISEYDFQSVAVHELGHGHQLGHVINSGAIMHYALSNGSFNRTLSANDIAGSNFVQAKSVVANVCGPGAMSNYTCLAALPLNVTSIKAYQKNNGIQVEWANGSESLVRNYEVQESSDGIHFNNAATIAAKANNDQSTNYEWFDAQVYPTNNYYRIKVTAYSGETKYSAVVNVKLGNIVSVFNVYPNPVKGKNITIGLNDLQKGIYTLKLFNAGGQQVLSKTIIHNGGTASENISLPFLVHGMYSIQLQGDGVSEQQKILVDGD